MTRRLLATLLLLAAAAHAAEVVVATVGYRDGRFLMHSVSRVQAPEPRVRAILTDFGNLPAVNGGLKSVTVTERLGDGGTRMQVASRVCILAFCLTFDWPQTVRTQADGDIVAVIGPGGDFREGRARWRLIAEDGGTRMIFDADLVPAFWFPPLIGPWLIKRKLQDEALETARGVERAAGR
ncbi:MAG: SRPBCC family protein [Pseudomonadota bacterium]|nr:SRPBCC family protein [Pseudomonadota bacterium]